MTKYRVKTKSFINHGLVEEGEIVEYDGVPGDNLEPLDEEGREASQGFDADAESLARQQEAAKGANPATFEANSQLV